MFFIVGIHHLMSKLVKTEKTMILTTLQKKYLKLGFYNFVKINLILCSEKVLPSHCWALLAKLKHESLVQLKTLNIIK